MYTYEFFLDNLRCLFKMTIYVEAIVSVYLPSSPSERALTARETY